DGICLSEGWNFVSIPYVLENQSFEDITEGLPLECIMEYNSKECIWTNPGCEWVPLKGYWIYANETCCIPDDRLAQKGATAPGNLELYKGWNAIGHSDSTDSLYAKTVLGGIDNSEYRYIMGPWDPVKKTYTQCGYKNQTGMLGVDENDKKHRGTDIFEMSPHEGYWLYMNMTGKYGPVGS
ncbi:MAG: hypothetical protein PHU28_07230, partial [Methanosarcinaceae archaeon]|nr:hypothetical protein [Methanosarcinaceae archaeon]